MLCSSNSSSLIKIATIKILLEMYYRIILVLELCCCFKKNSRTLLHSRLKVFLAHQAEEKHGTFKRLFYLL